MNGRVLFRICEEADELLKGGGGVNMNISSDNIEIQVNNPENDSMLDERQN